MKLPGPRLSWCLAFVTQHSLSAPPTPYPERPPSSKGSTGQPSLGAFPPTHLSGKIEETSIPGDVYPAASSWEEAGNRESGRLWPRLQLRGAQVKEAGLWGITDHVCAAMLPTNTKQRALHEREVSSLGTSDPPPPRPRPSHVAPSHLLRVLFPGTLNDGSVLYGRHPQSPADGRAGPPGRTVMAWLGVVGGVYLHHLSREEGSSGTE